MNLYGSVLTAIILVHSCLNIFRVFVLIKHNKRQVLELRISALEKVELEAVNWILRIYFTIMYFRGTLPTTTKRSCLLLTFEYDFEILYCS